MTEAARDRLGRVVAGSLAMANAGIVDDARVLLVELDRLRSLQRDTQAALVDLLAAERAVDETYTPSVMSLDEMGVREHRVIVARRRAEELVGDAPTVQADSREEWAVEFENCFAHLDPPHGCEWENPVRHPYHCKEERARAHSVKTGAKLLRRTVSTVTSPWVEVVTE